MKMTGKLSARLTRGSTGRSADVLCNDEPTVYSEIERFVAELYQNPDLPFDEAVHRSAFGQQLLNELSTNSTVGLRGRYFRGRVFSVDAPPPGSREFGPPPAEYQEGGRYNLAAEPPVLYLSRQPSVCLAECRLQPTDILYVQEFELALPDVRWLFLGTNLEATAPVLHGLLLASEVVPDEQSLISHFRAPYRATQFVSDLCRRTGVGALEYPSVRGGYREDPGRVNLVVFGSLAQEAARTPVGSPKPYPWPG